MMMMMMINLYMFYASFAGLGLEGAGLGLGFGLDYIYKTVKMYGWWCKRQVWRSTGSLTTCTGPTKTEDTSS